MITQSSAPKRQPLKPLPCSGKLTRCEPRENNLRIRARYMMRDISSQKMEIIQNATAELELRLVEGNLDAALSSVRLAHAAVESLHSRAIDSSEPISALGMSTYLVNQLEKCGYKTLRSLAGAKDAELLEVRGLTRDVLAAIRQRLRELRISRRR